MAGKGRGMAALSFNIEALGIGRGSMPEARVGPNPLFPTTEFKPVPLKAGEEEDYMLALKQEMRGAMQRRPHHIKPLAKQGAVERYTERYLKLSHVDDDEWTPDWNNFPKELMPQNKKPKRGTKKKPGKLSNKEATEVLSKLDELAKKDDVSHNSDDEAEKKRNNPTEEEEEELEEEEYDEEDIEDNDYIDNYFDNGEDFCAESDDNMDGEATY